MNGIGNARETLLRNVGVFEGLYLDKKAAKRAVREIKAVSRGNADLRGTARVIEKRAKDYFKREAKNAREIRRFLRRSRKRLLRKEKGKSASYAIKPAEISDVRQLRRDIADIIRGAAAK